MMQVIGFIILGLAITGFIIFVIGNDLEVKDQIRLFIGFSIFIIAITIGAGMLTGWK